MSDLAFVMGIGFDAPPEGVDAQIHEYMSLQIAVTGAFIQQATGATGSPVWVTSALGKGPADAKQSIARQIGRVVFYGHTTAILVGRERAEQGIEGILDAIERYPGFRRSVRLFIVDGQAKSVLEAKPKLDQISVLAMLRMVRHAGIAYNIQFGDFMAGAESLTGEGSLPIVGTIPPGGYSIEKKDAGSSEGGGQEGGGDGAGGGQGGSESSKQSQEKIIHMGGIAIFRGKKMVGTLEGTAADGFLIFKKQYVNRNYAIETQEFGDMAAIIRHLKIKSEVNIVNGQLQVRIKSTFTAGITQVGVPQDFKDKHTREKATRIVANKIANDIKKAVTQAQACGADVFDFGGQFFRRNPKQWEQYKDNWPELFRNATVHSEATGRIIRTGITSD